MTLRSSVTVLEAADSYDLTTLAAVKAYFAIPIVTDDPNDVRLQTLITLQSKVIADYCDRVFAHEKVSETIYTGEIAAPAGISTSEVLASVPLSRWPVTQIDSITRDTTVLVEADDYRLDADSGVLRGVLIGDALEVVYEAGYDLPEGAPGPLSLAVIDMVRQSYFYGSRDPMIQMMSDNTAGSVRFFPPPGISSGRGGGGATQSKGSPLTATATALVQPYRRPGLA
jgi:hypothetical protein